MPGLPEDPRPPDPGRGRCGHRRRRAVRPGAGAHAGRARGLDVLVIEARPRLGGRVLTAHCDSTGQALDLGATWFWPQTEPRMAALLDELGLSQQPAAGYGGRALAHRSQPRARAPRGAGRRACRPRAASPAARSSWCGRWPPPCRQAACAWVSHWTACGIGAPTLSLHPPRGPPIRARQVVLALPPRLVHQQVRMEPALPHRRARRPGAHADLDGRAGQGGGDLCPTVLARPGSLPATLLCANPQAVLGEVFDAGDGRAGALGRLFLR